MKYRVKFERKDEIKFVGYLDLLRTLLRAVRRAEIPVSYSKGFNPHQKMSYALPLSVGATSSGEYIDIELDQQLEETKILEQLNNSLPDGLNVLRVKELKDEDINVMTLTQAVKYQVTIPKEMMCEKIEILKNAIDKLFEKQEVLIIKKGKDGMKVVNVFDKIIQVNILENLGDGIVEVTLKAGNDGNVKPESFIEALYKEMDMPFDFAKLQIHRIDLYYKNEDELIAICATE